ncbi:MAG: CYTH domain-containing protein [Phycisphaerales bacterium]|nr:MAG: CYTH domain-containing protein [Phycisphaerales bacterium]
MRIVDVKHELRDPNLAHAACMRAGMLLVASVAQNDTHFRVPDAHLLRRVSVGGATEWLFYTRQRRVSPRLCSVHVYSEAAARSRFGVHGLRVQLAVRKRRTTWLWRGVRINLDDVSSLGLFAEIESPVGVRTRVPGAAEALRSVRDLLGPALGEPVSLSYRDLMAREIAYDAYDAGAA